MQVEYLMYKLINEFSKGASGFHVTLIGCGGTGGYAAEGLCRVLPPEADLILIDHDRVEERNLIRQNFFSCDLGKFKSEVLAERLSARYDRRVGFSLMMISDLDIKLPGIVVGCVDNGLARGDIAEKCKSGLTPGYGYESWWVDSGNGENYGQVLIGNHREAAYFADTGWCYVLPLPTIQRPELLYQLPAQPGCAQIEQGPTINQAMAFLVVEVVRRIIEGSCEWMQLYLDLEAGALRPVYAIPDSLRGILKKNKIMKGGPPNERRS
jgi:hypothetical protein